MRKSLARTVAVSLLMALTLGACLLAQSAPPSTTGSGMLHDLSGVYGAARSRTPAPGERQQAPPPPEPVAPMTPAGQAQFDYNTHEIKNNRPITIDPAYTCHWPGLPHVYVSGAYAYEIVQTPQRIFILYENTHSWREIWMDGRPMPADLDPLWMGYSVGHWDGEDLIVDTAGFNGKTWVDSRGHPESDALKLTERYHKPDHDHIEITFTIDDPKMYTAPWKMRVRSALKPTWAIGEAFCLPEDMAQFFKESLQEPGSKATPDK